MASEADAVRVELEAVLDRLEPDALRVVHWVAERMARGREAYGPLELRTDGRDFEQERAEELGDLLCYSAMIELKRLGRRGLP